MRALVVLLLCAGLIACSDARRVHAPVAEPATLIGDYLPASVTARSATGAASLERGGIVFEKGVVLFTRTLHPRSGDERIARDGGSYATVAVVPDDLTIELRRVTQQTLSGGAKSLCGDADPGYVALAYDERARTVTMLVFAGDEPPGPDATESHLCATLAYIAPEGARTSQGVVL